MLRVYIHGMMRHNFLISVKVVAVAGECLKAVLATSSGSEVLNKLETSGECDQWCGYLVPFKTLKRKKVNSLYDFVF